MNCSTLRERAAGSSPSTSQVSFSSIRAICGRLHGAADSAACAATFRTNRTRRDMCPGESHKSFTRVCEAGVEHLKPLGPMKFLFHTRPETNSRRPQPAPQTPFVLTRAFFFSSKSLTTRTRAESVCVYKTSVDWGKMCNQGRLHFDERVAPTQFQHTHRRRAAVTEGGSRKLTSTARS